MLLHPVARLVNPSSLTFILKPVWFEISEAAADADFLFLTSLPCLPNVLQSL